jgi:homoserine trans-succinylase
MIMSGLSDLPKNPVLSSHCNFMIVGAPYEGMNIENVYAVGDQILPLSALGNAMVCWKTMQGIIQMYTLDQSERDHSRLHGLHHSQLYKISTVISTPG